MHQSNAWKVAPLMRVNVQPIFSYENLTWSFLFIKIKHGPRLRSNLKLETLGLVVGELNFGCVCWVHDA